MCRKFSAFFLILCFGGVFSFAQSAEKKASQNGLTLEITFFKGRPPAFQSVANSAEGAKWSWYSMFKRIPDFKTSAERLPVRAVKFVPYLEDDVVKINVTAFTGEKTFDREEAVAAYSMREGERIAVRELIDFGVEPFELAVVRVTPSVAALPLIENRTASLQIVGIEPNFSTLPSYTLRLLNSSDKAVSAFTFAVIAEGQKRASGMPQGLRGESLIESGKTFTRVMSNALEYKAPVNGQAPKQPAQTFVISSVIFADGSYEGEIAEASQFRAFNLGRKSQLKKIIRFLQESENIGGDPNKFIQEATKLEKQIGDEEFAELLKEFPSLNEKEKVRLRGAAEVASHGVKKEFIDEMENRRRKLESNIAGEYLAVLRKEYQQWLERL